MALPVSTSSDKSVLTFMASRISSGQLVSWLHLPLTMCLNWSPVFDIDSQVRAHADLCVKQRFIGYPVVHVRSFCISSRWPHLQHQLSADSLRVLERVIAPAQRRQQITTINLAVAYSPAFLPLCKRLLQCCDVTSALMRMFLGRPHQCLTKVL